MQKESKTILDLVPVLRQLADTLESLSETLTEQEVQTFEPVYPPEEPTPVPPAKEPPAVSMDAVRALLQRHGAAKLSAIAPSEYPALLEEANKIG